MTERLWLEHPSRRACLAKVAGLRGEAFVLDRTIFDPGGSTYRHPTPGDRGEVWVGGDKRILRRAFEHRGEVRHLLAGTVPPRGQQVRCMLDAPRREAVEAAHLAMHLVLSALVRQGRKGLSLVAPSRVLGGGHFRLTFAPGPGFDPKALADALAQANQVAGTRTEVRVEFATRDGPGGGLRGVDPQPHADALLFPGPEDGPVRVVRVGEESALPCDGAFPTTTVSLGRVVAPHVRRSGREVAVGCRVLR